MIDHWKNEIRTFIELCTKQKVKMLLVGGGAVNFHGYQRHSADVDFWIDTQPENLKKLVAVFKKMGYEIDDFPESVKNQTQNISIKFSPTDFDLELITKFSINKTFKEAFEESTEISIGNNKLLKFNVLSFNDLITSKVKSGRPKDLLDIQELKRNKPNG